MSIIVSTYNNPDMLRDCLDSIVASDYQEEQCEVVVVDHGPAKAMTRSIVSQFPVRYIKETSDSVVAARNRGVMETTGEIVVFVDDDVIVPNNCLSQIKNRFSSDEGLMCLGVNDRPIKETYLSQCLYFQSRFSQSHFYSYDTDYMRIDTTLLAVKRLALNKVGLFNANYSPHARWNPEDTELIHRMISANFKVIRADDIIVLHHYNAIQRTKKHFKEAATFNYDDVKAIDYSFRINFIEFGVLISFVVPILILGIEGLLYYSIIWLAALIGISAINSFRFSKSFKFTFGIAIFHFARFLIGMTRIISCYGRLFVSAFSGKRKR